MVLVVENLGVKLKFLAFWLVAQGLCLARKAIRKCFSHFIDKKFSASVSLFNLRAILLYHQAVKLSLMLFYSFFSGVPMSLTHSKAAKWQPNSAKKPMIASTILAELDSK